MQDLRTFQSILLSIGLKYVTALGNNERSILKQFPSLLGLRSSTQATIVYVVCLCCNRKRIRLVVALHKVAAQFVAQSPATLLVPPVQVMGASGAFERFRTSLF